MKTISSLTTCSTISDSDYFVIHTDSGDRKVTYSEVSKGVNHNCILRGKSLGTVTADNIDTFIATYGIEDGTFDNLYIGDYFTITFPVMTYDDDGNVTTTYASRTIRVAGINTFKYTGDTSLTANHIVCVPDSYFGILKMNSTNTTGVSANTDNTSTYGAYAGSDMNNIYIPTINSYLENIFGTHLLTHREILATVINEEAIPRGNASWVGASSARSWFDVQAVLLSEPEIYGSVAWGSSGYDLGITRQLPLFSLDPRYISSSRVGTWLREVASSSLFCNCYDNGGAACLSASNSYGVRPRFLLG